MIQVKTPQPSHSSTSSLLDPPILVQFSDHSHRQQISSFACLQFYPMLSFNYFISLQFFSPQEKSPKCPKKKEEIRKKKRKLEKKSGAMRYREDNDDLSIKMDLLILRIFFIRSSKLKTLLKIF